MNSYQHFKEKILDEEKARLKTQASVWWENESDLLSRRLFTARSGVAVDLGCGEGTLTLQMAAHWPGWSFTGLDDSAAMLPGADAVNVSFLQAPAGRPLPLADASADAVYARFLFQHVSDPAFLLSEIFRVLKPGGRLLCLDVDDRGVVFEPPLAPLTDLYTRAAGNQQKLGGSRTIGARLPGLLGASGLVSVSYEVIPVTCEDFGFDAFFRMALGLKLRLLGEEPAQISAIAAEARACPGFVGVIPIFAVSASKPSVPQPRDRSAHE